jgi:hypothetical protein
MVTPGLPMATAFEIASCEELRAVRKIYRFHFSPVIWSATAGSTIRIFLFSSATGRSASAAAEEVVPMAMSTLSS